MVANLTSAHFLDIFLATMKNCKDQIPTDKREEVWTQYWNYFMMWDMRSENRPCSYILDSVLNATRKKLGLEYWPGEALTLDAVFYRGSSDVPFPFPIIAALEHELNSSIFHHEVAKLLSIRCPLKVGITYINYGVSAGTAQRQQTALKTIHERICAKFEKVSSEIRESEETEYLFLIGIEEGLRRLFWHSIEFSARRGPSGALPSRVPNEFAF